MIMICHLEPMAQVSCKAQFIGQHEILVLISCAKKPPLNTHVDVSSGARDANFRQSLHLHQYYVIAGS